MVTIWFKIWSHENYFTGSFLVVNKLSQNSGKCYSRVQKFGNKNFLLNRASTVILTRFVGALRAPPRSSGYPGQDASLYNNPIIMICASSYSAVNNLTAEFGQMCVTRDVLMQLQTILCQFGPICVTTKNALMQLKIFLCDFWQICATRNALMNSSMQVWTDLCNRKCS